MSKQEQILADLARGVLDLDTDLTVEAAHAAVEEKIEALTAINEGLVKGMGAAGDLFEQEEYFVPEILLASDALYAGLEILSPHLNKTDEGKKAKIVIGVVEGDTHDIGKNLVKILLEAGNFEVYDLGRDVPAETFVAKAQEVKADIIGLSTLMTTTMPQMEKVIRLLTSSGLRESVKVIVGGGPISPSFARSIGADGYADNANDAVRLVKSLLGTSEVRAFA